MVVWFWIVYIWCTFELASAWRVAHRRVTDCQKSHRTHTCQMAPYGPIMPLYTLCQVSPYAIWHPYSQDPLLTPYAIWQTLTILLSPLSSFDTPCQLSCPMFRSIKLSGHNFKLSFSFNELALPHICVL